MSLKIKLYLVFKSTRNFLKPVRTELSVSSPMFALNFNDFSHVKNILFTVFSNTLSFLKDDMVVIFPHKKLGKN